MSRSTEQTRVRVGFIMANCIRLAISFGGVFMALALLACASTTRAGDLPPHPRLLLTPAVEARIRKRIEDDPLPAMIRDATLVSADAMLDRRTCEYRIPDGKRLLGESRRAVGTVLHTGMALAADGKAGDFSTAASGNSTPHRLQRRERTRASSSSLSRFQRPPPRARKSRRISSSKSRCDRSPEGGKTSVATDLPAAGVGFSFQRGRHRGDPALERIEPLREAVAGQGGGMGRL